MGTPRWASSWLGLELAGPGPRVLSAADIQHHVALLYTNLESHVESYDAPRCPLGRLWVETSEAGSLRGFFNTESACAGGVSWGALRHTPWPVSLAWPTWSDKPAILALPTFPRVSDAAQRVSLPIT